MKKNNKKKITTKPKQPPPENSRFKAEEKKVALCPKGFRSV